MKIGLFGGSFNPVHKGHIFMAKYAIEKLGLDELVFVPCYRSVDKTDEEYVDVTHRLNMLLQSIPDKCSISTFEISKRKAVETIDTLKHFSEVFYGSELFFIMGDDLLPTIDTWKNWELLDQYAKLIVFRRKDSSVFEFKKVKIFVLNNDVYPISSSEIRNKQKTQYLPTNVEIYIRENNLYGYCG